MGSQVEVGIGPHAMWGYTPTSDLLQDTPIKGEVRRPKMSLWRESCSPGAVTAH